MNNKSFIHRRMIETPDDTGQNVTIIGGHKTFPAVMQSNLGASYRGGTLIASRVVVQFVNSMKGLLMSQPMRHCFAGAIAGLLATVPMTVVMIAGKRFLPPRSQDPLPPVQITKNALQAVRVDDKVSREEEIALTAVSHFGFGASTGALYGALLPPRSAAHAMTSGCSQRSLSWHKKCS